MRVQAASALPKSLLQMQVTASSFRPIESECAGAQKSVSVSPSGDSDACSSSRTQKSLLKLYLHYRATGRITADETDERILRKVKIMVANVNNHYHLNTFDIILGSCLRP